MSAMKSAEVSKTFGISQPYVFPGSALQETTDKKIDLYPGYTSAVKGEQEKNDYGLGIEVTPGELVELGAFREFLSAHVKPNAVCDVQCMLLWAEWVRFYKKKMHAVPELILEREFRYLIMNQFDLSVTEDGFRGYLYPGIKYVP